MDILSMHVCMYLCMLNGLVVSVLDDQIKRWGLQIPVRAEICFQIPPAPSL